MSYQITVDWSPAYELAVSLEAYFSKTPKTLDLGQEWVQGVQAQGGEALMALEPPHHLPWLDIAIWRCPGPRDVAGFLDWLATCSIGHLYELFAPYALEERFPLPADLGAIRTGWVSTLVAWNEGYFRHLDPAILAGLAAEAAARREEAARLAPEAVVERATCGILFTAPPDIEQVLLVPQYHCRPLNIDAYLRGWRLFFYPAETLPLVPDEPPLALLRLTGALADHTRLRILRLLAGNQHTFTEIVQEIGLAKSTIYQHLVTLRAAGLVRLHDTGPGPVHYTLRPSALEELRSRLHRYLTVS